jgi:hypothetical protein
VIVGQFAVDYHNEAAALGIDLQELYAAMLADGEDNPFEWDIMGREINVYKYVRYLILVAKTSNHSFPTL